MEMRLWAQLYVRTYRSSAAYGFDIVASCLFDALAIAAKCCGKDEKGI